MPGISDEEAQRRTLLRRFAGRPALWQGIVWTALGLVWLALAFTDPTTVWRWVIGGLWVVLGVVNLVVSVSDYRNRRGRYSHR